MSRKINFINNVLVMAFTIGGLIAIVLTANSFYTASLGVIFLYFAAGALIAGFLCTLFHELGHLIAGKSNGFAFLSMTVWFFKWSRERNKTVFDFVMMGDEAGYTEMVAKSIGNLDVRLKKMTLGGLIATVVPMVIGVIPFFLVGKIPFFVFVIWSMFLPVGAYVFFGNALPMSSGGAGNDGRVLYGLKKMDDDTKVILSMLCVQSELFNGKTPAEIDEKYFFDVPQLAEDDLNFIMLLSARYDYYLDKKDYENAKRITDRLLSLLDYVPKHYANVIKTNALYNSCTFDRNEEVADDLTFELEKYLNKH
ncbi:MAG: hypothetical protein IJU83_03890, partial [Clostridia bacterium]|nr:hypothetical protein [Clostridia bacterium]